MRRTSRTVVARLSENRRFVAGYRQPAPWHHTIVVAVAEIPLMRSCTGVVGVVGVVVVGVVVVGAVVVVGGAAVTV